MAKLKYKEAVSPVTQLDDFRTMVTIPSYLVACALSDL